MELTAAGAKLAKRVKERHKIVFAFLIALGVDEANAEIDSEGIEHHVGPKTIAAMKNFIKSLIPPLLLVFLKKLRIRVGCARARGSIYGSF